MFSKNEKDDWIYGMNEGTETGLVLCPFCGGRDVTIRGALGMTQFDGCLDRDECQWRCVPCRRQWREAIDLDSRRCIGVAEVDYA